MTNERRTFNTEYEADETKIKGYGAVFNKRSENLGGFYEVIEPGAFDGVLGDDVRALINHNSDLILARTTSKTLKLWVDENGLGYEVEMPDTTYARDLMVSTKRGDISQSSFGFIVDDDTWEEKEGIVLRTIKKIKRLLDVSVVTYPAYPDTSAATRSLKQFQDDIKQNLAFEHEKRERELTLISLR